MKFKSTHDWNNQWTSSNTGSISGDINNDGILDISDIIQMINIILSNQPYTGSIADMSGDGIVDIGDLVILIDTILNQRGIRNLRPNLESMSIHEINQWVSTMDTRGLFHTQPNNEYRNETTIHVHMGRNGKLMMPNLTQYNLPSEHLNDIRGTMRYIIDTEGTGIHTTRGFKSCSQCGGGIGLNGCDGVCVNGKMNKDKEWEFKISWTFGGSDNGFGDPIPLGQSEAYYCTDEMSFGECQTYLLSVVGNSQGFVDFFSGMNENTFNRLKSGQMTIEEYQNQNQTRGIFCGGSECGNFYGFGGCNGGQACCGVGGLGVGCNYKFKDKKSGGSYAN